MHWHDAVVSLPRVQVGRIWIVAAALALFAAGCTGSESATPPPDEGTRAGTATVPPGPSAASGTITADELCELMPLDEIGTVMDSPRDVTTFASPSEPDPICLLLVFNGETTVNVSVELVSTDGDAGLDQEAADVARLFGTDAFELDGVGDRAVGFETSAIQVLVLAGQSVVRIIGPEGQGYSIDQAGEIGRLVAARLG